MKDIHLMHERFAKQLQHHISRNNSAIGPTTFLDFSQSMGSEFISLCAYAITKHDRYIIRKNLLQLMRLLGKGTFDTISSMKRTFLQVTLQIHNFA